jgi:hypothetical protein
MPAVSVWSLRPQYVGGKNEKEGRKKEKKVEIKEERKKYYKRGKE